MPNQVQEKAFKSINKLGIAGVDTKSAAKKFTDILNEGLASYMQAVTDKTAWNVPLIGVTVSAENISGVEATFAWGLLTRDSTNIVETLLEFENTKTSWFKSIDQAMTVAA